MKLSLTQRFRRLLAVDVIVAAVPDHRRSAAVISFRDHALERFVFNRMVLHFNRQMFFAPLPWQTFRERPGFEHAFHLQPKIVVQPPRVVFLNDEAARATDLLRPWLAFRLSRARKIPFSFVFLKSHPS